MLSVHQSCKAGILESACLYGYLVLITYRRYQLEASKVESSHYGEVQCHRTVTLFLHKF